MMKVNRVGNKLALAGLVGILLSVAVVANELRTAAAVAEANRHADVQQRIADNARATETELGSLRLATRAVRMAVTSAEIDKGNADMVAAKTTLDKSLDATMALLVKPANKERFSKIKALAQDFMAGAGELVSLQRKLLDLYRNRNVTTAVTGLDAWPSINAKLMNADLAINAVRAAAWRYAAMNEAPQKALIAKHGALLTTALAGASVAEDNELLQQGLVQLGADMKRFMAATDETTAINDRKTEISVKHTSPAATQASELVALAVGAAQQAVAEARQQAGDELARSAEINLVLGLSVVTVLIGTMVFSFMGVARPMTRLNGAMAEMAGGNLDVVIPGASRGDEIGDIAKTVTVIRENAESKARSEAAQKTLQDNLSADNRKREMAELADNFEQAVGNIVETVSLASNQLEQSASALTATAEQSKQLTAMVSSASDEASSNVQAVATSTEEMSSSVNEISRQVQESANIANSAVSQARKTNDRVAELAKAAARIGDVVELINTIAGQTNLLALNATIEAARAGDAGRGFAVVASEVKALAEQTAKATGDISQQISGIQAATEESVGAIREIGNTIGRMSEIASTIASAVEQQGAATHEIARNVQQAAQGTRQVSDNIGDVQRGAIATGSASSQVLSAAQSLSQDSHRLKAEVSRFLDSVRAA
jgi:methyl-accepting chemotaxis protein